MTSTSSLLLPVAPLPHSKLLRRFLSTIAPWGKGPVGTVGAHVPLYAPPPLVCTAEAPTPSGLHHETSTPSRAPPPLLLPLRHARPPAHLIPRWVCVRRVSIGDNPTAGKSHIRTVHSQFPRSFDPSLLAQHRPVHPPPMPPSLPPFFRGLPAPRLGSVARTQGLFVHGFSETGGGGAMRHLIPPRHHSSCARTNMKHLCLSEEAARHILIQHVSTRHYCPGFAVNYPVRSASLPFSICDVCGVLHIVRTCRRTLIKPVADPREAAGQLRCKMRGTREPKQTYIRKAFEWPVRTAVALVA